MKALPSKYGSGVCFSIIILVICVLWSTLIPLSLMKDHDSLRTMGMWWNIVLFSFANLAIGATSSIYDIFKKKFAGFLGIIIAFSTYPLTLYVANLIFMHKHLIDEP